MSKTKEDESTSSHELINQSSGNTEYYTPHEIVEAARRVMGCIDLDPASSLVANDRVKADKIYTAEQNGLQYAWVGNVWMNHPFGRDSNRLWVDKLIRSHSDGLVPQSCCITYACTSEAWFRPLMQYAQCFLSPRTNYLLPDGTVKRGVTKGSVVTYMGLNVAVFAREFKKFGTIKVVY